MTRNATTGGLMTRQSSDETTENNCKEETYTPFTRYNRFDVVSCVQIFTRLSNRIDNRFDNRLYRVNGALLS